MIIRTILFAILSLIIFGRCAQTVTPTGGKKDSIAPVLIQSIPVSKTLNFKGDRIELFFDEYVVIDNINQKLVITPEADNPYSYKLNGESVVLNFKKKFKDSTTYTLNFGDAIKDFAEKNPAKNLKIVFSTGASLDSGRVYGTLRDVKTSKPLFDALVGLYNISDTLNIAKQKPYYFSRTDSSGRFSIENVQIRKYRLIAIEDKNRNMLYNAKDERVGFLNDSISAASDSVSYSINMALSDVTPMKIQRTIPKVNNYTVVFNKGVEKANVSFTTPDTLPYILENSQLKFFNLQPHSDTVQVKLVVTDSLGTDSTFNQKISFMPQRGKERQRDPFSMTVRPEQNKPLSNNFSYFLQFSKPVALLDTNSITLISDSLTRKPLKEIPHEWNKFHNQLTISGKATSKDTIKWEFPKGSIISVEGDTLVKMLMKHPLLNEEDYGKLTGTVLNIDSSMHVIVELVDEQFKVLKTSYTYPYKFEYIPEGRYYLRVTLDRNNNKRWDSGRFDEGKQPETILYLPDKMLIKSNFELNDINISVPK
ncbi:hypothetical protein DYBT9275_04717 [Dyadobacter sp. CECT 9275]|uniref:SbsA Ig-like domain-containing protein n=1 Tax=Dyadobacter helix TaxID=2822344 RepID=A0A916JFY5_9BACT|nr:Ig-like domain-containing domain [Dyadobacter sp. CECT 9275]CAG5010443.1 hypothetical protein DYBT9275_04717 [Dyadobacter sp. CECT 9275]